MYDGYVTTRPCLCVVCVGFRYLSPPGDGIAGPLVPVVRSDILDPTMLSRTPAEVTQSYNMRTNRRATWTDPLAPPACDCV